MGVIGDKNYINSDFSPNDSPKRARLTNENENKVDQHRGKLERNISKENIDIKERKIAKKEVEPTAAVTKTTKISEKEDVERKSSLLWECVERIPQEEGGFIYKFKFRDEFKEFEKYQEINHGLFPAVEYSEDICKQILKPSTKSLEEEIENQIPAETKVFLNADGLKIFEDQIRSKYLAGKILLDLGIEYDDKENCLYLPDKDVLMSRWKEVKEIYPHLADLDIIESDGIASDEDFVEAHMVHTTIQSSGAEFVHDTLLHIMPTLSIMLGDIIDTGDTTFLQSRESLKDHIKNLQSKVEKFKSLNENDIDIEALEELKNRNINFNDLKKEIEKYPVVLGIMTDSITSSTIPYLFDEENFYENIGMTLEEPNWNSYLEKRFFNPETNTSDYDKEKFIAITALLARMKLD